MNGKIFIDTNILIYCYAAVEQDKRSKAQLVASLPDTILSTQVLNEFSNILRKKFNLTRPDIINALEEVERNFEVFNNTAVTINEACRIADRYGFSFYDSLIVAAALESGCYILYSEDLQHGQLIEKTLTVKNPLL